MSARETGVRQNARFQKAQFPATSGIIMAKHLLTLTFGLAISLLPFSGHPSTAAGAEVELRFAPASSSAEIAIRSRLQRSKGIAAVVQFVRDLVRLPRPLEIYFGGEDGPLFDPDANRIEVPYGFAEEIRERFKADKYSETGVSVEEASQDVLMHTLFHELGHALVAAYDFPVVGKEEDAVDALATVLLIEYFEDGAEIAISAADLFDLESDDVTELGDEDFWDEHSLDAQRFFMTLCHVYGSDPETYAELKAQAGFDERRADLCVEEYEAVSRSWLELLKPHLREGR